MGHGGFHYAHFPVQFLPGVKYFCFTLITIKNRLKINYNLFICVYMYLYKQRSAGDVVLFFYAFLFFHRLLSNNIKL